MLVEALITLVNARGIDLKHVAGAASNTHGVARQRRLSRAEWKLRQELRLALHIEPTAKGAGTRVARKATWSHAELAQAMAGVPRMPELALYYSLAGWLGGFEELHRGLMLKVLQTMDDTWPMVIQYSNGELGEPHDYVHKLATLVLIADAHKQAFIAAPGLPSALMRMDETVWNRTLAPRYQDLQRQYERWYTMALAMTQRRLMSEDRESA